MRYLGGKTNIGKEIAKVLKEIAPPDTVKGYCEPFCGSLGVMVHMVDDYHKTLAYDKCKDLILLWKEIKKGMFKVPRNVSERTWNKYKKQKEPSAMRAFIGFGCSFGGVWFSGFVNKYDPNGIKSAIKSIKRKEKYVKKINKIGYKDYKNVKLKGYLVYCDPPYNNKTEYKATNNNNTGFDSDEFWDIIRKWSKDNIVIISEYKAPKDFKCIWKKSIPARISPDKSQRNIEKLFIYKTKRE
jgi:DNA adenine methylase